MASPTKRVANKVWITKSDFGILRYVHFLSVAYLAWVAAGVGGHRLIASGSGMLSKMWDLAVMVIMKVGQQSLAVFVFSMVLARVLGFAYDQVERSTAVVTIGNLIGVALLIFVAYFVGYIKAQPWRVKPK